MPSSPPPKTLLLVGGGHAHVEVLRRFRERPEAGVDVVLVSRDEATAYSGMLPGLIAGHYAPDEAQIDLPRLARACGARFIRGEAVGLDPGARRLRLRDGQPLAYDVVSFDTGSTPDIDAPGAREHALPVKPVPEFLAAWEGMLDEARAAGRPPRLAVVGGGAGGVETALSIAQRLRAVLPGREPSVTLLARGALLRRFNARARRLLRGALDRAGIAVLEGAEAARVEPDGVVCADGRRVPCDRTLWVAWAGAPAWLRDTGLALDARGFLAVAPTLRALHRPEVFAAGDVAAVVGHPREKAGVYAVRQGPPLASNLRRALRGEEPRPFVPQRTALALVGTGDGGAVAARGPLAVGGRWVWAVKETIDRRWIRRYRDLAPRA